MPVILVGRTHHHVGKRLWEIIGSLKDYGVGRMVVRSTQMNYPEPSFYKILSARPEMDTGPPHHDLDNMKGKVLVERVFRGKNLGIVDLSKVAYKTQFQLVHKRDEHKYIKALEETPKKEIKILPQTLEMPPLLKYVAERENHSSTSLKRLIIQNEVTSYRLAEDGETPTVEISSGLGTPVSPELYEGI